MIRLLLGFSLALGVAAALAEGPGSRIRTNSDMSRLLESLQHPESGPCGRLRSEAKDRCMKESRKPVEADRSAGPESTGMGSATGSGSSTGTGGASAGGAAPR